MIGTLEADPRITVAVAEAEVITMSTPIEMSTSATIPSIEPIEKATEETIMLVVGVDVDIAETIGRYPQQCGHALYL